MMGTVTNANIIKIYSLSSLPTQTFVCSLSVSSCGTDPWSPLYSQLSIKKKPFCYAYLRPFEAAQRGNKHMVHQNIEDNEQTSGRTYTFTEEQLEEMFTRFATIVRTEQTTRKEELPNDIQEVLDKSNSFELRSRVKQFLREVPDYQGGDWTTNEVVNKAFIQELKNARVDTYNLSNKNTQKQVNFARQQRLPQTYTITSNSSYKIQTNNSTNYTMPLKKAENWQS